jgi:excinuclease ABC subunit A
LALSSSLDFLEDLSPAPSAYHAAVRRLRSAAASHLRPLRVAVAASFRAEPLGNYLVVEGARRGFHLNPWFTPYGQFELQCSTPDSALFAERPDIIKKIRPLAEVGLGYVRLGQPTTTLSGGELQRIKLAFHLIHERDKHILYLFDEPTIGLHPDDVMTLLRAFQRLVAEGHSLLVIEHNLDVIKCADHVIDLGPEGGLRGGEIVAQGTPEDVARSKKSITARYLRKALNGAVR